MAEHRGCTLFDAFVSGAGAGCTAGVGAEVAGAALGLPLLAVSCTRIVWPTSAAVSVYLFDVAPGIAEQFLPEVSHRCHR